MTSWYAAAEARRAKIRHLAGHSRMGSGYTMCGKTLGPQVAGTWPYRACLVCEVEAAKRSVAGREEAAPAYAVEAPGTPELGAWWARAHAWCEGESRAHARLCVLAVGPAGFYYSGTGFFAPQFLAWGRIAPQEDAP